MGLARGDANRRKREPSRARAVIFRGVDAVMDNVTGAHNVSFTPTVAGKIGVSVRVESDGSFLYADAPVRSNSVNASASEVFGVGADVGSIAGKTTHFYVQLRDALRNPASLEAGVDPLGDVRGAGRQRRRCVARKRRADGGGGCARSMESSVCRGEVRRRGLSRQRLRDVVGRRRRRDRRRREEFHRPRRRRGDRSGQVRPAGRVRGRGGRLGRRRRRMTSFSTRNSGTKTASTSTTGAPLSSPSPSSACLLTRTGRARRRSRRSGRPAAA